MEMPEFRLMLKVTSFLPRNDPEREFVLNHQL